METDMALIVFIISFMVSVALYFALWGVRNFVEEHWGGGDVSYKDIDLEQRPGRRLRTMDHWEMPTEPPRAHIRR